MTVAGSAVPRKLQEENGGQSRTKSAICKSQHPIHRTVWFAVYPIPGSAATGGLG